MDAMGWAGLDSTYLHIRRSFMMHVRVLDAGGIMLARVSEAGCERISFTIRMS